MRETLLVDRFVMDSEKVAAAVQSPGTVQLRLLPEDWGPDSEKVLRRLVDARAHGQLEWGSKHSAFLLLNARAGRVVMTLVIARK
ncbi:hypothetical protein H632_c2384p2 [Helicosporidium sp. ATCC 50920]|nr:hypothetical protein H632_c2384p2 [Helicosporidium sp. ATCC 50920]|eukprot:KDD73248.1 hypothetical protein H632_c2384p2 [Helicosporidium sp. ATCC 50920]